MGWYEDLPPLYITEKNFKKIGIREWGLPTGKYVGRTWRSLSGPGPTLTTMLPHKTDPNMLSIKSWRVVLVRLTGSQNLPKQLLEAMKAYKEQWPSTSQQQFSVASI